MLHGILHEHAGKRLRSIALYAVRGGVQLLMILLLLELCVRFVAPEYLHQTFDNELTGGRPAEMQAIGNRGAEIPRVKPADQTRVLVFGDSVSFGTGVRSESAWPAALEEMLNSTERDTRVINASLPAGRLKNFGLSLDQAWSAYNPDAIVLAVTCNQVTLAGLERDEQAKQQKIPYQTKLEQLSTIKRYKVLAGRWLHETALPSFLSLGAQRLRLWLGLSTHATNPDRPTGPLVAMGWRQADLNSAVTEAAWRAASDDIRELAANAQTRDITFVVLYVPPRFQVFDSLRDNEKLVPTDRLSANPSEELKAVCKRLSVPFVDATDGLRAQREHLRHTEDRFAPLYVLFDYTHLDPDGHEAVANAVRPVVEEALKR